MGPVSDDHPLTRRARSPAACTASELHSAASSPRTADQESPYAPLAGVPPGSSAATGVPSQRNASSRSPITSTARSITATRAICEDTSSTLGLSEPSLLISAIPNSSLQDQTCTHNGDYVFASSSSATNAEVRSKSIPGFTSLPRTVCSLTGTQAPDASSISSLKVTCRSAARGAIFDQSSFILLRCKLHQIEMRPLPSHPNPPKIFSPYPLNNLRVASPVLPLAGP